GTVVAGDYQECVRAVRGLTTQTVIIHRAFRAFRFQRAQLRFLKRAGLLTWSAMGSASLRRLARTCDQIGEEIDEHLRLRRDGARVGKHRVDRSSGDDPVRQQDFHQAIGDRLREREAVNAYDADAAGGTLRKSHAVADGHVIAYGYRTAFLAPEKF